MSMIINKGDRPIHITPNCKVKIVTRSGKESTGSAGLFKWTFSSQDQPSYLDEIVEYELLIPANVEIPEQFKVTAATILQEGSDTYRERNASYGSNFRMIGPMMKILFPEGLPDGLAFTDQFHLFELVLVKISRLAISNLTHVDSARDAMVYCAMIEAILHEGKQA